MGNQSRFGVSGRVALEPHLDVSSPKVTVASGRREGFGSSVMRRIGAARRVRKMRFSTHGDHLPAPHEQSAKERPYDRRSRRHRLWPSVLQAAISWSGLQTTMKFYPIDLKSVDWKRLDAFADRTVFQTREWLQFIAATQNARLVLAELRQRGEVVGFFSGLTFSRFGIKVLGSSFPGWTTPYIGFKSSTGRLAPRCVKCAGTVCVGRSPMLASRVLGSSHYL